MKKSALQTPFPELHAQKKEPLDLSDHWPR